MLFRKLQAAKRETPDAEPPENFDVPSDAAEAQLEGEGVAGRVPPHVETQPSEPGVVEGRVRSSEHSGPNVGNARSLTVSLLDTAQTNQATRHTLSLEDFMEAMCSFLPPRAEKDGPAWSPILWEDDARSSDNAESVSALVYDLDTPTPESIAALGARLENFGWVYAIHETWRSRVVSGANPDGGARYRLVLPLARDIAPKEYERLFMAVAAKLDIQGLDEHTDLARLFYLPARADGQGEAERGGSKLLSPEEIYGVQSDPAPTETRPKTAPDAQRLRGETHRPVPVSASNARAASVPRDLSPVAALDLSTLRARVKRLNSEAKEELLAALDGKCILKEGQREDKLHKMVCGFVTVMPWGNENDDGLSGESGILVRAETQTQRAVHEAERGQSGDASTASDLKACRGGAREDLWQSALAIFLPVVEAMENVGDKGVDYYMGRVRFSFDRSYERRKVKEDQRQAAIDYFRPEPGSPDEWKSRLIQAKDRQGTPRVKACTANVDLILEHDPLFRDKLKFDELRRKMEIEKGGLLAEVDGSPALELSIWLQRSEYNIEVSKENCGACLLHSARRHGYNPVREYLEDLVWDGTPRISRVLLDYCGAGGNEKYIENITRKFFISAAARGLSPGCKVDTVLVLQGAQGTGKTSAVELLAGEWYTTVNTRIDDKDTKMQATGAWFVELSELATAAKSTIEQLRGFLTQRRDQIRLPYAEAIEDFPRRCVFMGTTNADQPLSDPEGNRRYWVVSCGRINTVELTRVRDQLWAEAVYYFRQHEKQAAEWARGERTEAELEYRWWLTPDEQAVADMENDVYMVESPLEGDLAVWLQKPGLPHHMTTDEMAKKVWHFTTEQLIRDGNVISRINRFLKSRGWEKVRRGVNRKRYWAWVVPVDTTQSNG